MHPYTSESTQNKAESDGKKTNKHELRVRLQDNDVLKTDVFPRIL